MTPPVGGSAAASITSDRAPGSPGPAQAAAQDRRKWLILAVIAIASLMVILDATVVNIALPSAQKALHFSNAERQWVVTAYALAFGSLLLLGGKLADLLGRKLTFIVGLIGFAVASAIGGASGSFDMLVAARASQGAFAALLTPTALSLLTTTFPDKKDRGKAFGVYGAIVASGGAIGLLLGGVLTEYLSWRWCLYINLFFATAGVIGAVLLLHQQRPKVRPKVDLLGAVAVSAGLFCLVYGCSNADTLGWHSPLTWGFLVAGVALLGVFVWLQARVASPLLPLRIVLDRNRAGSYVAMLVAMAGMAGVFLFLTYYLQATLGYSAVVTGLAFLPMLVAASAAGLTSNIVLLARTGPKPLVVAGMLVAAVGVAWLTRIGLHSSYANDLLGPLMVMGLGVGLVTSPAMNTATFRVPAADAGVASATAQTQQQVGTSIGTALLNTLAVSATAHYLATATSRAAIGVRPSPALLNLALVHGYSTAFWWGAGIFVVGAVACGSLLRNGRLAGEA